MPMFCKLNSEIQELNASTFGSGQRISFPCLSWQFAECLVLPSYIDCRTVTRILSIFIPKGLYRYYGLGFNFLTLHSFRWQKSRAPQYSMI
jgi:hypothetical protein